MKPFFRCFHILLAALALSLATLPAATANPAAPRLVCDGSVFDAGPVAPSAALSHVYILHNDGELPLEIHNARASTGGFRLSPPARPIPPGESAPLRADLSLAGRTGPQSGTIVLSSNDPDAPAFFLSFRCDVVPPPAADPSFLRFDRIADPSDATRTVTLTADRPFTILSASSVRPQLAVEIDSPSPASTHTLSVTVLPSMSPGPFGDTLTVELDLPVQSSLQIPLTGDWRPPAPTVP